MSEFWNKSAADPWFRIVDAHSPAPMATPARLWRSVAEREGDAAILQTIEREFSEDASAPLDEPSRRQFLQVMGASLALASASGCFRQPQETIVPYVSAPELIIPGKPLYYATAMTLAGASTGLLVETHMGRPTKVEGNPLHPAVPEVMAQANERRPPDALRVGATDPFGQAVVLSLYDPDRSQVVLRRGQIDTWASCFADLRATLQRLAANGGQGLRLLTESVVSPTLAGQINQLLDAFPNARWHQYEPVNDDNALAGARLAFDEDVSVNYLERPAVVLSLDADCFADGPMRLQLARRLRGQEGNPLGPARTRFYVVETSATSTGASADHRLPASPQGAAALAVAVARRFGLELPELNIGEDIPQPWLDALVEDLDAARGRSLVLAGRGQPPVVHAIAHLLNDALGNVGQTVEYRAAIAVQPELHGQSIRELAQAMQAEEVQALVILGGNPVYDAPADLNFTASLERVPFSLHLAQYEDETSLRCTWHVPETHLLESWGDTRAGDGTVSIVQPLIAPLYRESKTTHELVAAMLGNPAASTHELVREHWRQETGADENDDGQFERGWQIALHDGVIAGTQAETLSLSPRDDFADAVADQLTQLAPPGAQREGETGGELHLVFRPDPAVWDGRFANNAWLQELPRPLTKLTWDNALLMSPRTADEQGVTTGDVVEIEAGGRRLEMPVFVVPGHPRRTLTAHLGYGRRQRRGRVGNNVGTNVYPLRTTDAMWFASVTSIGSTGRRYPLATTQHHHLMEGRHLVHHGTLRQYEADPEHPAFMEVGHHNDHLGSLYPEWPYEGYKWGMVVNQSACIGCNACVVACHAENNIPVVGKDQVARGREMHWLRIDNYYEGEAENPESFNQPMMCVHCEKAPCEPVCPVAATSHSAEGINEMTYNRCVGTRYCANNCPYKVRRFNFYDYNAELRRDPVQQLRPNPDVTIRSRGVMEKCTYCVQRINAARIDAKKEDRSIRDGEMLTACQAACPTEAITFGDLNDQQSAVRTLAQSSLNYPVLGELNTRPRTTYLAVVRNQREMKR